MVVNGAILSLNVKNFFCHDNLKIDFNKNINFIVGRNGSGKSAILTALVVGLGARANVTNRGNNLRSFIKQGANSATIEIKIRNSAENPYKHDIYGDVITVVRVINSSGGSSYKIKNIKGEIISRKHDEVVAICAIHDIQVDNPMCILNQDEARNFHASDAKKKYSLFKRATNLDLMEKNYNKVINVCQNISDTLKRKNEACLLLEKKSNKLKIEYEKLMSRDDIRKQLKIVQDEYFWSEIAELETELDEINVQYKKYEDKVNYYSTKIERKINKSSDVKKAIAEISNQMKDISKSNEKSKFEITVNKYKEAKANWKSFSQQLQKKRDQIDKENSKINELSNEIQQAKNKNSADTAECLQSKKIKLNEELSGYSARENTIKNEIFQINNALSREVSKYENLLQERKSSQIALNRINSQLNELNVRGENNLAIFGIKMIELDKRIKEACNKGVFSAVPRGPIGFYLKVCDKKWTSAIEHIIGGNVTSFCVNTDDDFRKLFNIMKQVYGNDIKPTIITSQFFNCVHDVSKNAVQCPNGYFSALNCLQVDDVVVKNFLIDNLNLECILLVPQQDEAISFTANINNVPRNCIKVVTLDSSEFYPMPNYRTYGGRNRPSKYLQVNTSERKRQLTDELKNVQNRMSTIENDLKNVTNSRNELSSRENNMDAILKKYMNRIQMIKSELKDIEDNLKNTEGGHVRVLMEELNLTREKMTLLKQDEESFMKSEASLKNAVKATEEELSEIKKGREGCEEQKKNLNEERSKLQLELESIDSEKSVFENKIKDEQKKLDEWKKKSQSKKTIIQEKTNKALKLCERVRSPRDKNVVFDELQRMKEKIISLESAGSTKEEVAILYKEIREKYETTSEKIERLTHALEEIKKSNESRIHYLLNIRKEIYWRMRLGFTSALNLRGYTGSMEINYKEGTLELRCFGKDSASNSKANTTNSLSGGERSYATVAFIMSLWECMEIPFYFLDEFDVFMDNVNRKIVMDLLISHAKKNLNKQFVFLTPQDTSTLEASDIISINKMADPVRKT